MPPRTHTMSRSIISATLCVLASMATASAPPKMTNFMRFSATGQVSSELTGPVSPRIFGGTEADDDIKDRTALIRVCYSFSPVYGFANCGWCSSAVIRKGWLLTAAHCLQMNTTPQKVNFVLVWLRDRIYFAKTIYVHRKFIFDGPNNIVRDDIALIRIHGAFDGLGRNIMFRLAQKASQTPGVGSAMRIAGFGLTAPGSGVTATLQMSTIPRLVDSDCFGLPQFGFICSRPSANGVQCSGDSGGPLFVNGGNNKFGEPTYLLIGINSGNSSPNGICGEVGTTHFHAEVLNYADAIISCVKGSCSSDTWVEKNLY